MKTWPQHFINNNNNVTTCQLSVSQVYLKFNGTDLVKFFCSSRCACACHEYVFFFQFFTVLLKYGIV